MTDLSLVEPADDGPTTATIEWMGAKFHVGERVGLMPMMKFAVIAKAGVDADELEGLAAQYELLQQCIHPADWDRFEKHANDTHADGDELLEAVTSVFAELTARPPGRPSVSSDGPRTIEPGSTGGSSSLDTGPDRVIRLFNEKGRPDLALLVRKRQESLSA